MLKTADIFYVSWNKFNTRVKISTSAARWLFQFSLVFSDSITSDSNQDKPLVAVAGTRPLAIQRMLAGDRVKEPIKTLISWDQGHVDGQHRARGTGFNRDNNQKLTREIDFVFFY